MLGDTQAPDKDARTVKWEIEDLRSKMSDENIIGI
jgi:hypothetical protein